MEFLKDPFTRNANGCKQPVSMKAKLSFINFDIISFHSSRECNLNEEFNNNTSNSFLKFK